jgi:hypothetical protein
MRPRAGAIIAVRSADVILGISKPLVDDCSSSNEDASGTIGAVSLIPTPCAYNLPESMAVRRTNANKMILNPEDIREVFITVPPDSCWMNILKLCLSYQYVEINIFFFTPPKTKKALSDLYYFFLKTDQCIPKYK